MLVWFCARQMPSQMYHHPSPTSRFLKWRIELCSFGYRELEVMLEQPAGESWLAVLCLSTVGRICNWELQSRWQVKLGVDEAI